MPNEKDIKQEEILKHAAKDVFDQLAENPNLAIPLDPELAEYMGAFEEKAVNISELDNDTSLNENGEISHVNEK